MSLARSGVVTSFLFLLVAACGDGGSDGGGGGSSSGGGGTPCQQLSNRMCQKARECAAGSNSCGWNHGSGSLGRNCSVCEGGIVDLLCNDPTKTAAQIDACAAAFDTGTCGGGSVKLPTACNDVLTCGGGPCKN